LTLYAAEVVEVVVDVVVVVVVGAGVVDVVVVVVVGAGVVVAETTVKLKPVPLLPSPPTSLTLNT